MSRLHFVAGLLLLSSAGGIAEAKSLASQLDGEWSLVSSEQVLDNGSRGPSPLYGQGGVSHLVFTDAGEMCAMVASRDDMNAYCGQYQLNEGARDVVFDVQMDGVPNDLGDKLHREITFDHGKLKLRTVKPKAGVAEYTLTFKRM